MVKNFARVFFAAVFRAFVHEIADVFFLFGVYGNYRIANRQVFRRSFIYVFKLCVPIWVGFSDLLHFLVLLPAVIHRIKDFCNCRAANFNVSAIQFGFDFAQTFCCIWQHTLGIPVCWPINQSADFVFYIWLCRFNGFASAACAAYLFFWGFSALDFLYPFSYGRSRNTGYPFHFWYAATSVSNCFAC